MNKAKVSVIITCYNLGKYLPVAVESVLKQTHPAEEIIIVDDGSNDEHTKQVLVALAKQYPHLQIIKIKNSSAANARNVGIKASTGDYLCCLDADDKLHPAYLAKCLAQFARHRRDPSLGIITTDYRHFGLSHDYVRAGEYNPIALAASGQFHVASLFKRECWQKVGGYCQYISGHEDWEFWLRVVAAGYRWLVIPEALFYYRDRPGSKSKINLRRKAHLHQQIMENNRDFYRQNHQAIIAYLQKQNYLHAQPLLKFKKSLLGSLYTNLCALWRHYR